MTNSSSAGTMLSNASSSSVKTKSNHCIKLRGLPWSSSKEDILSFLDGCSVVNGIEGIHMIPRSGPTRGEAFVELESQADVETALSKHRQHMGSRYIEVFTSSATEMAHMTNPKGPMAWRDPVLRLRGIPYYCTKQDIYDFFSGLQIAHNGVYISMDEAGNASGVAFVAFVKMDTAYKALEKHRQMIGHRYVELFQSSYAEARARMVDDMEANGYGDPRRLMTAKFTAAAAMGVLPQAAAPAPLMGMPTSASAMVGAGLPGITAAAGISGLMPPPPPVATAQSVGGGGGGSGPHNVVMTGLPYKTSEEELNDFFRPLKPIRVQIRFDGRGRPTGEAIAEFKSHDEACEAMKYDKRYIGQRYVDLTLESSRPDVSNSAATAAALLSASNQVAAAVIGEGGDGGPGGDYSSLDTSKAYDMYRGPPPPHGQMQGGAPPNLTQPAPGSMPPPPPNYPNWGAMPGYDRWY
ncbi:hypothetical protein ACOME3_002831 [Neoechinorhynchus agilis]